MQFPDSPTFSGVNASCRIETDIAQGPIATVKLPLRLKPAYHGSWSGARLVRSFAPV
jgi:hypothetical protein